MVAILTSKIMPKKLNIGFFSFTCCQGCEITVLFIDKIYELLKQVDVGYFHLLKEKNRNMKYDLVFIEGAITTKKELKKLKEIRRKSKFVVALGACACHGGIPAMRNFLDNKELERYTYTKGKLKDAIEATGIGKHVNVDYFMRGCPIIKKEFVDFLEQYINGEVKKDFLGPVCLQCPRRGTPNCFMRKKVECLGSITHGGCNAICTRENIPCMMCRGPLKSANFGVEVSLFTHFGLEDKDVKNKLNKFYTFEEK